MPKLPKPSTRLVSWTPPQQSGLKPRIRIITGARSIQKDLASVGANAQYANGLRALRPDTQWMKDLQDAGYTHEDVTFKELSHYGTDDSDTIILACLEAYEESNWIPPLAVAKHGMTVRAIMPFGLMRRKLHSGYGPQGEYQNHRLAFFYVVYRPLGSIQTSTRRPFIVFHTVMDPVLKLRRMHTHLKTHKDRPSEATSYELDFLAEGEDTCFDLLGVEFASPFSATYYSRDVRVREKYFPEFRDSKLGWSLINRFELSLGDLDLRVEGVQVDTDDLILI